MRSDPQEVVFDWSNFSELVGFLFASAAEPDLLETSSRGQTSRYVLPTAVGEGRMEFLQLSSGMRVLIFDCSWHHEQTRRVIDGEWIRFNFSLSANMTMHSLDSDQVFPVFPSWRIINTQEVVETVETFFAGQKLVWVTVCCKPEHLSDLSGIAKEDMPLVLQSILSLTGGASVHDMFDFSVRLNAIATDIIRCSLPGGLRIAYIEARAIELLCYALDHVMHPRDDMQPVALSDTEKIALNEVHSTLMEQFADPPTVVVLARNAGVNRNKLYYGFKTMFGMTISEYVQSLRLDEGHRLLVETNLPIIDIANRIGFQHQCNFSTAMKKRFGMSPSQIRSSGP